MVWEHWQRYILLEVTLYCVPISSCAACTYVCDLWVYRSSVKVVLEIPLRLLGRGRTQVHIWFPNSNEVPEYKIPFNVVYHVTQNGWKKVIGADVGRLHYEYYPEPELHPTYNPVIWVCSFPSSNLTISTFDADSSNLTWIWITHVSHISGYLQRYKCRSTARKLCNLEFDAT